VPESRSFGRRVGREQVQYFHQRRIELLAVPSRFFLRLIAFEAGGIFAGLDEFAAMA